MATMITVPSHFPSLVLAKVILSIQLKSLTNCSLNFQFHNPFYVHSLSITNGKVSVDVLIFCSIVLLQNTAVMLLLLRMLPKLGYAAHDIASLLGKLFLLFSHVSYIYN